MKISKYLKKSLSNKFTILMGFFLVFFIIVAVALLIILHELNKTYLTERNELTMKEKIAQEINDNFSQSIFDGRGYLAFGSSDMKDNALSNEMKIKNLIKRFEKVASTENDESYLNNVKEFVYFYFDGRLPDMINKYEKGNTDGVEKIAENQGTQNIAIFQKSMDDYLQHLDNGLENHFQKLMKLQNNIQVVFIIFILVVFLILLRIMTIMFQQIGQPLSQLASTANQIASDSECPILLSSEREDEIGMLTNSFQKMVEKVRDKEQDLMAQNEELLAQQEELQAQQIELENALQIRKENEEKIKARNILVNQISNSLNKNEVLESIVVNTCKILGADKGIIAVIADESYASFGIAKSGVNQFISQLKNGLFEKLTYTKEPFSIRRELEISEKGYHEGTSYCHDLYLPIFSTDKEIIAVMVYTQFGLPFLSSQMGEFKALSKSIGITLEKIFLFQRSEEERKRTQDILNTLQEGVQLIDVNGTTLQTNDYFSELYDCYEHSSVGMSWEDWIVCMEKFAKEDGLIEYLDRMKEQQIDNEDNTFIYHMKNKPSVIKVYSQQIYHGTEKLGTILVHRDITREYEVDQMKSEFVSTVSHELRTPLSSILGFTELMLNRNLNQDRQNKYLSTIFNETKRLTSLINDFLDVQKMEAGKQTYEKKNIELLPILSKIIEAQQVNAKQHKIILQSTLNNPIILGDKNKVEQVFLNLINNAVKYSPEGGEINVRVLQIENELIVQVVDSGLGIPEDSIDKLFTKFYRIDNSDRRRIGGTGLGLAIVQEIMKAHNGRVSVQSQYGNGSTFSAMFPAVTVKENFINDDLEMGTEDSYRILLIEDDPILVELICQELTGSGFHIVWFNNRRETSQYLSKEVPDAIVLDILLGDSELDGWDIMKELKQNKRLKEVPVIVSSAIDEREKGFSLGAVDYLVKPYKPSELSKSIMQILLKMGQKLISHKNN